MLRYINAETIDEFAEVGDALTAAVAAGPLGKAGTQALHVHLRPSWLGATVHREGRSITIDAVALYWGVRRLIFDHTATSELVGSLDNMIAETWARLDAAGLVEHLGDEVGGEDSVS